jgi:quinol-cytochrome oxidoreductase complex cytochrome b subunit
VPDNFIGDWIGFVLIDAKLAGVIAFAASLMIFFALPFLDTSPVRSSRFRPIYKWFFWIFVLDCIVLTWLGAKPPEGNYKVVGQIGAAWYFIHFLVVLPVLGKLERPRPLPKSISEPVLKGGGAVAAGAAAKPMGKV